MSKILSILTRKVVNKTKIKDNYIVFESDHLHLFDNSYYLYLYLKQFRRLKMFYTVYTHEEYVEAIKKGLKKSHIFMVSDNIKKHTFINMPYILKWRVILKKCKLCFISYRNFYKEFKIPFHKEQIMVNLRHGQYPYKDIVDYLKLICFDENNNNMFSRVGTEESLKMLPPKLLNLNCIWFASPMPRIDAIFENKFDAFCKLINIDKQNYNNYKYILSMTTFRGDWSGPYFETQFPINISRDNFDSLNTFLKDSNIIFIVKCHHENTFHDGDLSYKSSNILLVDDSDLEKYGLYINNIFRYTDALITDFSSCFFDYLYVNRPIGFITADLKDYQMKRGFTKDFENYVCGMKINNLQDLITFIKNIYNGVDEYKEARDIKFKIYNGCCKKSYSEGVSKIFINNKYLR